jgi:hypothetical protein
VATALTLDRPPAWDRIDSPRELSAVARVHWVVAAPLLYLAQAVDQAPPGVRHGVDFAVVAHQTDVCNPCHPLGRR